MNNKSYFVPDYILRFKCSMCAKCCANWNIRIDKQTMEYYKKISKNDEIFALELRNYITENLDGTGKILFINSDKKNKLVNISKQTIMSGTCSKGLDAVTTENLICPFLTEKSLCSIQLRYGIEALPDVSKKYPRIIVLTERGLELSLDYSCPTATELLKEKNPIKFYKNPEGFDFVNLRGKYNRIGDISERKEDGKADYFRFEELLIRIMQLRELDIDKRLFLAGIIVDRISNDYTNGMNTCLENIKPEFTNQNKSLISSPPKMLLLVKKMIEKRIALQPFSDSEMQNFFITRYDKLKLLNNKKDREETIRIFIDGYNKLYKPFEENIMHIYENYFVNYIFSKKYYTHAYMDAYFIMVFVYILVRFFTICKCFEQEEHVSENMLVDTIRILEYCMGHLNGYYENFLELFKNESKLNLSYIFSIISISNDERIYSFPEIQL